MKTKDLVNNRYHDIPRVVISNFISTCFICNKKIVQQTQPRLTPIRTDDFWTRMQIDLIDMRHKPDGLFNWICHCEDHFSKFHIIWPLTQKTAENVTTGLNYKL